MTFKPAQEGRRVLISAPFGRDAESVALLLGNNGYDAHIHADLASIARAIDEQVGVVLLTEEALQGRSDVLRDTLRAQADWSDIPFILLAARRTERDKSALRVRELLGAFTTNAIVIERPLAIASLLSAAATAMRARKRQFDMRDRLADLDRALAARYQAERELILLNESLEQRVQERTESLMQAEAELRQSQKMEAVGQLTGGIAHDFNNMLTGVIGALDILKRRISSGRFDDLDRFMDAASTSAQRAASLTARLLAFSRRQSLDMKAIDVSELITSLEDLLKRTISESVALKIVTNPELPRATADANQLESAILNLAINARDAMPAGGELTIEAKDVVLDAAYAAAHPEIKPGRYVVIVVTDTGVGMAPEILQKVFDPFFTTKPLGQGTGLGLSMVYGFARQSNGQVRIHSQPGIGTSVSLFLMADESESKVADLQPDHRVPEGTGQTVLVVEDDPAVRLLIREVLAELQYEAIEADRGDAAIPLLASDIAIDLMISDVGLPGLNGRQLAEIARQHRPQLPILFVTGYAENAAIRAGFLGKRMTMITKPFALEQLGQKISEMLADAP